ncbi:mavicyanin [Lactuca sativa]|uniref:mavicyanin n=1 Tax=Lactuca sativa TaxID=4236 RepID=UPI001C688C31|nr:mavicyanin [Lactuca sativa]
MELFNERLTAIKTMLCMLLMIQLSLMAIMVKGEVYKVGDSSGWVANTNSNYSNWASSKIFRVHDILMFEYNSTNDNVIRVTHSDFRSCNTSSPIKTFNSGNDSFTIKAHGHYYFTSGFPGHCVTGQKLDVRVPKSSHVAATPPPKPTTSLSPSPNPSNSTMSPMESKAMAPSPVDNAVASHEPKWLLMSTIGVAISGFVVLVCS